MRNEMVKYVWMMDGGVLGWCVDNRRSRRYGAGTVDKCRVSHRARGRAFEASWKLPTDTNAS